MSELCYSVLQATSQREMSVNNRQRERSLLGFSMEMNTFDRREGWMRLLHRRTQKKKKERKEKEKKERKKEIPCLYVRNEIEFVYGCLLGHQTCYTGELALLGCRDKLCIVRVREP